jgi:fermentation-respiration switch protein FrsA (DUF1100 family)
MRLRILFIVARRLLQRSFLLVALCLHGCSGVFFYPDQVTYSTPEMFATKVEDVYIPAAEGVIHAWWMPADEPRGSVFYLHGNAQNLTSHVMNVSWLPRHGYSVMIFDYRGYGQSTGKPDLAGVLEDSRVAYHWFANRTPHVGRFILGQSLGGTLSVRLAADASVKDSARGLIADAAFSSYQGIVREKLGDIWLTWPLQYPLSWLVPEENSAILHIDKIDMPLLIFHSTEDVVIPFHHGTALFDTAREPKQLVATDTPHVATFQKARYREDLLTFLEANRSGS